MHALNSVTFDYYTERLWGEKLAMGSYEWSLLGIEPQTLQCTGSEPLPTRSTPPTHPLVKMYQYIQSINISSIIIEVTLLLADTLNNI